MGVDVRLDDAQARLTDALGRRYWVLEYVYTSRTFSGPTGEWAFRAPGCEAGERIEALGSDLEALVREVEIHTGRRDPEPVEVSDGPTPFDLGAEVAP